MLCDRTSREALVTREANLMRPVRRFQSAEVKLGVHDSLKSKLRDDGPQAGSVVVTILFLAANPLETTRLMLDEEIHQLEERVRRAEFRELFDLKSHFAVRVDEIPGLLKRYRPTIVHFSGHGTRANEIILDDGSGGAQPVSANALGDLFSIVKDDIRCVVLNSCYSATQAQAIAKHVDCVIGMSMTNADAAAISFVASFYEMLGYGSSIGLAFKIGCWMLRAKDLGEETPKLICHNADADTIVLARREITDPPELVSEITRTLILGDDNERLAAARELTKTVRKSLTAVLIERSTSDPFPPVRHWLNRALGKIGTPAAIEVLRENRSDDDVYAAVGAEDALAELDR